MSIKLSDIDTCSRMNVLKSLKFVEFDGMTYEEISNFLRSDKFKDVPKDATFTHEYNTETDTGYYYFEYSRLETDEEYSKRIWTEDDAKTRSLNNQKLSLEQEQRNLQKSLDDIEVRLKDLQAKRKLHTIYWNEQQRKVD